MTPANLQQIIKTRQELAEIVQPIILNFELGKKVRAAELIKSYSPIQIAYVFNRRHFGYSGKKEIDFFVMDVMAGHWDKKIERERREEQEAIRLAVQSMVDKGEI